jgi:hypothetical protein
LKIEGAGRLDDLKEKKRYWEFKEETLIALSG